jgi:hypothetical protein
MAIHHDRPGAHDRSNRKYPGADCRRIAEIAECKFGDVYNGIGNAI